MTLALALDLGTTSTAAVAVDDHGKQVHVVRRDHSAAVTGLPAGHAEQSPRRHLATALDVLKELAAKLTDTPHCLGLTGQMHSVLSVDPDRRPLGNLITWQDRRANLPFGESGRTYLGELLSRCDTESLADTGCRLSPGYAAVTLFILQEQGRIPANIAQACCLADWVAAELTDSFIVTDRSNAASTGVYDLRHDCWSEPLIATCRLKREWLPPVFPSGSPMGRLSPSTAKAAGLPEGLPVCTPIGDNQASVLGSVPPGEPSIQITIGTGGQINWPVESFVRVEGMDTRPLPPERMILVGAGLAGGDAYAWVSRTARQWLLEFGIEREAEDVYTTLNQLAAEAPDDADGLTCEPYFRGTRREPLRRGTISGIDTENFSPGNIARAVMNGIAKGFHDFWISAGSHQPKRAARIIGCGNGLERNPLLVRIVSDRFSMPVVIPRHPEAAACGAALLAGVETGLWSDLSAAGRALEWTTASNVRPASTEASEEDSD